MRRLRIAAAVLALGVGAAVLVAVLGPDDEGPRRVSGTPKEAVETVEGFRRALVARDFARICDELYSAEARAAAGGDDCQSILALETARLRDPRVRITSLTVAGGSAAVTVEAAVRGGRPATDTIRLVRQRGRFRIASAAPAAVVR